MTELWVARHGDTDWTRTRQHTSRTDLPLVDTGEEQAQRLREKLPPPEAFDLVLSSPLKRALQTARLAGFEPELDDRLVEWDYGDYEGRTTAEIQRTRPGWDLWRDGCPGGETADDVGRRVDGVIARIREAVPDGRALVFGHGHCLRVFSARWVELPPQEGRVLLLAPAGVGVMGVEHGHPAVARWGF